MCDLTVPILTIQSCDDVEHVQPDAIASAAPPARTTPTHWTGSDRIGRRGRPTDAARLTQATARLLTISSMVDPTQYRCEPCHTLRSDADPTQCTKSVAGDRAIRAATAPRAPESPAEGVALPPGLGAAGEDPGLGFIATTPTPPACHCQASHGSTRCPSASSRAIVSAGHARLDLQDARLVGVRLERLRVAVGREARRLDRLLRLHPERQDVRAAPASVACNWTSDPGDPSARTGRPSLKTIAGLPVTTGRRPGSTRFGWLGSTNDWMPRVEIVSPVPGVIGP